MPETIPALFARQAAAFGSKTLFLATPDGASRSMTWQEVAQDVLALAGFLLSQRVETGDRVLILSENRPEWGLADLAIQSVGAWTVPLYPTLPAGEVSLIARDCQPVVAIVSTDEQAQKLLETRAQAPSLRTIIIVEGTPQQGAGVFRWAEALAQGREGGPAAQQAIEARRCRMQPEDTATVIYTSGTTGEPKGVMLSHRNFLSNVQACLQVVSITGDDLHLSFLPLCHVFERMAGWYLMLSVGATISYARNMDTIPEDMRRGRPTIMLGVPRFFEKLHAKIQEGVRQAAPWKRRMAQWAFGVGKRVVAHRQRGRRIPPGLWLQRSLADRLVYSKVKAGLGGRLRFFVSGSAPLSKEIGEFFYGLGVVILEGYGLTETSPVIAVNRPETPRFGSVGPLVPGVEVRIAEDGEILTRGPHVMQGYYRKPEATAAALVDGWFHTGDIGRLDEQGCLMVTDRKKDLIKTAGGKFIAPQKLERLFAADPYISQVLVYGDRRPYCVALIVPNLEQLRRYAQEQEIAARSLQELVRDRRVVDFYWARVEAAQRDLAGFERVKKIALLDQEFSQAGGELTPTLKAKRGVIAARYEPLLNSLYEAAA